MAKSNGKIALVADASPGIGEDTAVWFAKATDKLYGTSRREAQTGEQPFQILPRAVTNDDAVSEGVRGDGRLDRLRRVNNAGFAHDNARRNRHRRFPAAST